MDARFNWMIDSMPIRIAMNAAAFAVWFAAAFGLMFIAVKRSSRAAQTRKEKRGHWRSQSPAFRCAECRSYTCAGSAFLE